MLLALVAAGQVCSLCSVDLSKARDVVCEEHLGVARSGRLVGVGWLVLCWGVLSGRVEAMRLVTDLVTFAGTARELTEVEEAVGVGDEVEVDVVVDVGVEEGCRTESGGDGSVGAYEGGILFLAISRNHL